MNKKFKNTLLVKCISVAMVLAMLFSVSSIGVYAERDFAAELAALEAKIDAANKASSNEEKSLQELMDQAAEQQKQVDILDEQIEYQQNEVNTIQADIDALEVEIAATDVQINDTNIQIDSLNEKIAETYDVLKGRLRASYMAGETSTLEILLGSSDYESFLTRLELLSVVAKKDDALVSGLQGDIKQLDDSMAELEKIKAEQEDKKAEQETKKAAKQTELNTLNTAKSKKQSTLDAINKNIATVNSVISGYSNQTAEYRAQMAIIEKAQAEYDASKTGGMSSGSGNISGGGGTSAIGNYPVSSKGMIGPLQYSNAYISQHFGHNNHKGVDICTRGTGSTQGKEIRAVADGTVYSAEFHYSWGNNVYINHGNGVYTRYAHCSSMIVKAGDTVKQGQVIGYVGSTGNSTGPHLHFEVWVNGVRTNPESWIPSLPD